MFGLGFSEMLIVGVVAVMLFGKRLPEVAKSMGKSYREFREGISEFTSHLDISSPTYGTTTSKKTNHSSSYNSSDSDYEEATAPKFDPPPSEPTPAATTAEQPKS